MASSSLFSILCPPTLSLDHQPVRPSSSPPFSGLLGCRLGLAQAVERQPPRKDASASGQARAHLLLGEMKSQSVPCLPLSQEPRAARPQSLGKAQRKEGGMAPLLCNQFSAQSSILGSLLAALALSWGGNELPPCLSSLIFSSLSPVASSSDIPFGKMYAFPASKRHREELPFYS